MRTCFFLWVLYVSERVSSVPSPLIIYEQDVDASEYVYDHMSSTSKPQRSPPSAASEVKDITMDAKYKALENLARKKREKEHLSRASESIQNEDPASHHTIILLIALAVCCLLVYMQWDLVFVFSGIICEHYTALQRKYLISQMKLLPF